MFTDDFIEVLDENEENIEVLDDFEVAIEKKEEPERLIPLDRLFDIKEDEIVVDAYEEDMQKEEAKQKIITKVQIGLIIFLVISATLFYFFGYNIVEPYINIG